MIEFLVVLAAVAAYTLVIAFIGWHTGVRTFRNRNRALHKALEEHRREMELWSQSPTASNWQAGFIAGQKQTLDAVDAFVTNSSG